MTTQSLIFVPHQFNFQKSITELDLSSIDRLTPDWTKLGGWLPLLPNLLAVTLKNGDTHRFVLFGRRAWAAAIESAKPTFATETSRPVPSARTCRDNVQWHTESVPDIFADEQQIYRLAGAHIAVFVKWVILRDGFRIDRIPGIGARIAEAVELVKSDRMSGTDFFLEMCDGKIDSWLFRYPYSDFADFYYNDYLGDVDKQLGDKIYTLAEDAIEFKAIYDVIDRTFDAFNNTAGSA